MMRDTSAAYEQSRKDFLREIEAMSQSHHVRDKFSDAVRMMAITLHQATVKDYRPDEYEKYEREYLDISAKYGKDGMLHACKAFGIVIESMERDRQDLLGHCLEDIDATNKGTGQFFTPTPVSRLMAKVANDGVVKDYLARRERGERKIIKMNDCACGAGVLMIEGAEELLRSGVPIQDIMIYAEDLDANAFNMVYVNLSLLGYAARVVKMDSLSMKVYEGPWWTIGYFIHCMPMRGLDSAEKVDEPQESPDKEEPRLYTVFTIPDECEEEDGGRAVQLELF